MKTVFILIAVLGVLVTTNQTANARGIRNNNPGNIRRTADQWQGLSAAQNDSAFFQFVSPEYGIRALAKVLINYMNIYNLKTVRGIINRYAPGHENDTEAYIVFVAGRLGYGADTPLDWFDLPALVAAIIEYENNRYVYSSEVFRSGLTMAGVTV